MPPDRWLALTIHLDPVPELDPDGPEALPDPVLESLPQILVELGGFGVEEIAGGFTTYLPPPPELDRFLEDVRATLERETRGRAHLDWSWQPHEDWEELWRRGLGPRRITPRLIVAPSWDIPRVGPDEVLVLVDPGMAFGTAEHATTRGCLRLLDPRVGTGDRIADVGSGSGILSIAAARLGADAVLAVEVDPMACEVAEENIAANGVEDRVRVVVGEILPTEPLADGPFDGIIANIQSSVLVPLLPAFAGGLTAEGWLILSGILTEDRDELLAAASRHSLILEDEDREEEWWSGAFRLAARDR